MTLASKLENILSEYSNDIIHTKENPVIIITKETFKNNGKVEVVSTEEGFRLTKYEGDINKVLNDVIIDITRYGKCVDVKVNYKNIISRLLNLNSDKRLHSEIGDIKGDNWVVTSSNVYKRFLTNTTYPVTMNDDLINTIIIGDMKSKVILREIDDTSVELYIDYSSCRVIKLI